MTCETSCSSGRESCDHQPLDIEDYKTKISHQEAELERLQEALKDARERLQDQKKVNGQERHGEDSVKPLRSDRWFRRPDDPGLAVLYAERLIGSGFTKEELFGGKPIIGIAQTGSDISPCNKHHQELAKRVRDGIRSAGAIAFEFPTHPIQESTRRPTATLDRNLAHIALVEVLSSYPFDGVVLLTGCDKTTPACLMAAAQVNIPAICLNVGPMLNGWHQGSKIGSGSVIWKSRELYASGDIDTDQMVDMILAGTPSVGHCNTMGTAATMNALAEALGMALPGSAAIPAAYRERSQAAFQTGRLIVELVIKDVKPRDIMTREAFENAIVINSAIGGSTNAPIHMIAIAKHLGVPLDLNDWDSLGYHIPLLLNMQPAGEMLSEDYYHAGGLPSIVAELIEAGKLPHPDATTVNGKSLGQNCRGKFTWDRKTIRPFAEPLKPDAGFLHLTGNLFDSAIMKMSVVSERFKQDFLEDPEDPNAFECKVAVFDGPEDYKSRLEIADIDRRTILVMRGVGPLGFPGAAEVVNMHAPAHLLKQGIVDLPCIGDGRQSGTSGSPSILNASPEAAAGGNLALIRDGDRLRVDLNKRRVDLLVPEDELSARSEELRKSGGYHGPPSQTPWQDMYRREVGSLSEGMVFNSALQFHNIAQTTTPRDNH
ncbi:putative dihydroxy acid dehydratase [Xylariales sp. PMI_506]|nr:putative dihydroxy acid dehydratase [Xylariales sp. PMI_506]